MIFLYTDFGWEGPYVGQVKAVLAARAPGVPVIDLMHDAPAHQVAAAASLLASLAPLCPSGSVLECVVDPGVGSERRALVLEIDGRWFTGPDNGLFEQLLRRGSWRCWEILDRPERLSATFHGRDLFAPATAALARGLSPAAIGCRPCQPLRPDWPDDLAEVIYIDRFGNMMTGLRAIELDRRSRLVINGHVAAFARIFADIPPGGLAWLENSSGLVEIAVNQGRADHTTDGRVGMPVVLIEEARHD